MRGIGSVWLWPASKAAVAIGIEYYSALAERRSEGGDGSTASMVKHEASISSREKPQLRPGVRVTYKQ